MESEGHQAKIDVLDVLTFIATIFLFLRIIFLSVSYIHYTLMKISFGICVVISLFVHGDSNPWEKPRVSCAKQE